MLINYPFTVFAQVKVKQGYVGTSYFTRDNKDMLMFALFNIDGFENERLVRISGKELFLVKNVSRFQLNVKSKFCKVIVKLSSKLVKLCKIIVKSILSMIEYGQILLPMFCH
jgi:hypothetical protein